jgi:hypothetical protein
MRRTIGGRGTVRIFAGRSAACHGRWQPGGQPRIVTTAGRLSSTRPTPDRRPARQLPASGEQLVDAAGRRQRIGVEARHRASRRGASCASSRRRAIALAAVRSSGTGKSVYVCRPRSGCCGARPVSRGADTVAEAARWATRRAALSPDSLCWPRQRRQHARTIPLARRDCRTSAVPRLSTRVSRGGF